jgi:hypothetical protein
LLFLLVIAIGVASSPGSASSYPLIHLGLHKLPQPAVALADETVGKLATIEHIYDLVKGNIESEIRDKIDRIGSEVVVVHREMENRAF